MYAVRRWSTRNAGLLYRVYQAFARVFHVFDPLWCKIGASRLEKPFAACEALTKGVLFDCRMCGVCVLSATGMTCPTNCPKSLRNGPCGGVRANGHCEVKPDMACVWVEAWKGSQRAGNVAAFRRPLPPRDHTIEHTSAWLRLATINQAKLAVLKAHSSSVGEAD